MKEGRHFSALLLDLRLSSSKADYTSDAPAERKGVTECFFAKVMKHENGS